MDHIALEGTDLDVDLESGTIVDKIENEASVCINSKSNDEAEMEKSAKEKPKKMSNKKPPRPPRPPRGPSLDSADQKLIREVNELATIKRARMERMRALTKAKNSKACLLSNNTILALIFTVIFFLVVIFQGMSPKAEAPLVSLEGPSLEPAGGLISVQYYPSPSLNYVNPPADALHYLVEKVAGSDAHEESVDRVAG